jgi:predicted GTPase
MRKKKKKKAPTKKKKKLIRMSAQEDEQEVVEIYSAKETLEIAKKAKGDSILMLGQTGGGKSSISNAIFSKTGVFEESEALKSCTQDAQCVEGSFFGENKAPVTVIDTPGFLDSEGRAAVFMAQLLDFIENFPRDRLRLVVVTLPFTEMRANASYAHMLERIKIMMGVKAFDHMVFVMTQANKLNAGRAELTQRTEEWRDWLAQKGIANPRMVHFDYEDPRSLEPLQEIFEEIDTFTPKAVEEAATILAHADMSVTEATEHIESLKQMKEHYEAQFKQQLAETERLADELRKQTEQTDELREQLAKYQADIDKLEHKVKELESRPPKIVMMGGGGGGCLSGDSLALLKCSDGGRVREVPLKQLKEGDCVATLNERNERVFSEVYFVDGDVESTSMLELSHSAGGVATLTADHVIFVASAADADVSASSSDDSSSSVLPIRADKVRVGDMLVLADGAQACVTSIRSTMAPSKWTVLTRDHTLLCDNLLTSCHVFGHSIGIAENALMLFVYDHISSRFVASAANKWLSRQIDHAMHCLFA